MATPEPLAPAERVREILEDNRKKMHPEVPADMLAEMAAIEEQNQFDDDRGGPRREIRELVDRYARALVLEESQSK